MFLPLGEEEEVKVFALLFLILSSSHPCLSASCFSSQQLPKVCNLSKFEIFSSLAAMRFYFQHLRVLSIESWPICPWLSSSAVESYIVANTQYQQYTTSTVHNNINSKQHQQYTTTSTVNIVNSTHHQQYTTTSTVNNINSTQHQQYTSSTVHIINNTQHQQYISSTVHNINSTQHHQ